MPTNKLRSFGRSSRCVVKRRGRKSSKLAKSKTRKYMTKKRVYRAGGFLGFTSDAEKQAAAAKKEAAEKKAKDDAEVYAARLQRRKAIGEAVQGPQDQISRFSRTTLPFMRFLYDGSEVSDTELQSAYIADKELKAYQITSIDAVKPNSLEMFKKYLGVFLQFMIDELVDVSEDIKNGVMAQIKYTGFEREEVEFEAFLNAVDAIREKPAEERAAALPEALFEAFSKLKDTKYVMLIPESFDRGGQDIHGAFDGNDIYTTYPTINETGNSDPKKGDIYINGLNCMYLWKLLSRNYSDFYSVIIDKLFTGSGKISFEEFIAKYNEWTLKKTDEMKKAGKTPYTFSRMYLMPFKNIQMDRYKKGWGYRRPTDTRSNTQEDYITVQEIE
jgi:hypothetical protein